MRVRTAVCAALAMASVQWLEACGGGDTSVTDPTSDVGAATDDTGTAEGMDAATGDDAVAPGPDGIVATDTGPATGSDAQGDAPAPVDRGGTTTDVPVTGTDTPVVTDSGPGACTTNADCGAGSFCSSSACGGAGRCMVRPTGCGAVYNPVCGCDGRTYGNTCEAAAAGARVRDSGACTGTLDAGPADVPAMDSGPSVCATVRCGAGSRCCDVPGTIFYGACYPTTCLGCCAGSGDGGVTDTGPTDTGPVDTGRADVPAGRCITSADCTATQYCATFGGGTSVCSTLGLCAVRPTVCNLVVNPVCGCDGITYTNQCFANRSGARVASTGACTVSRDSGVTTCGGVTCAPGYACCNVAGAPYFGRCYPSTCLLCCG